MTYKPDRVARSMKELLVLLEDQLHARGINLHILTGICAGIHRPDGATIADKMLFMVAAMAAEMERDLIRERTLDGLRAAEAQGRRGGRPAAVNDDVLAAARARQARGESVTAIARHLKIGRSTLYRALQPHEADLAPAAAGPAALTPAPSMTSPAKLASPPDPDRARTPLSRPANTRLDPELKTKVTQASWDARSGADVRARPLLPRKVSRTGHFVLEDCVGVLLSRAGVARRADVGEQLSREPRGRWHAGDLRLLGRAERVGRRLARGSHRG